MKILFIFAGQGYRDSNLFAFFQGNSQAMSLLNEFSAAAHMDFLQSNVPLTDPHCTQLIIGVYQLTLFTLLQPRCSAHQIELAGYSVGEVTALLASLGASREDCIKVYNYRTQLMTTLLNQEYELLSIRGNFDLAAVKTACANRQCPIAIVNSEQHLVVGGKVRNLTQLITDLQQYGAHTKFLGVHAPSHTPYYADKKGLLVQFMTEHLPQSPLRYPIISPLALTKIYESEEEKHLLDQELYTALQWHSACELMREYQYDLIIDLGPGGAMTTISTEANPQLAEVPHVIASQYKQVDGLLPAFTRMMMK